MARRVAEMPTPSHSTAPRYPWADWEDGTIWEAERGEDFDCSPQTFSSQLYKRARFRDLHVRVTRRGDVVTFRFRRHG